MLYVRCQIMLYVTIAIERARLYERSVQLGASEERNRLAREIHDTLAQGLAAIALQLESAEALLEAGTDTKRLRHAIRQALTLARANLEEARRSVLDLRAAPLEGRTLSDALASLLYKLAAEPLARCGTPVFACIFSCKKRQPLIAIEPLPVIGRPSKEKGLEHDCYDG